MREGRNAEVILERFVEGMFDLLVEQYRDHLAELGLTAVQAQAMRVMCDGPISTGQLAVELGISAPGVTQLVDRLVLKGLVVRSQGDDRRCVRLALSSAGKQTIRQFRARRNRILSDAIAKLSETERESVVLAFEKLLPALGMAVHDANGGTGSVSPGSDGAELSRRTKVGLGTDL